MRLKYPQNEMSSLKENDLIGRKISILFSLLVYRKTKSVMGVKSKNKIWCRCSLKKRKCFYEYLHMYVHILVITCRVKTKCDG